MGCLLDQIEAEEVRFGFQVLKLGAGFLALSAAALAAAFLVFEQSVVDAEENPAVTNDD